MLALTRRASASGPISATKDRHMLYDDKGLVAIARPHELKTDETYRRAGC